MEKQLMALATALLGGAAAIAPLSATAAQTMGNGLYMVIDLNSSENHESVSYFVAVPADGWTSDYKTEKLVLRRIDRGEASYYVGVFEVTEAQWDRVMGGSSMSTRPRVSVSYNDIRGDACVYDWPKTRKVARSSFMGKLRKKTGLLTLDLPTEAEWEFAARAGVTTKWLCGDSETGLDDYAWYKANSEGSAHEVGMRQPNAWGLYDVHGNAHEWCLNRYSGGSSSRAVRGGTYYYDASYCAFGCRGGRHPFNCYNDVGFRLACRPESN